jgi:hypothetical protein
MQGIKGKYPAYPDTSIIPSGWKVFDLTDNERVHASMMLGKLPEKKYTGIEEVIEYLENNLAPNL